MTSNCKSPFLPIPSGYTKITYDMCYNIFQTSTIPKTYSGNISTSVELPKLIINYSTYCTKYFNVKTFSWDKICTPSIPTSYAVGSKTVNLKIKSFQTTPTFDVSANGIMSAGITTGTKLVTKGSSLLGSVLYTANLDLRSFILNIKVRSKGDGYFFNNYGFDLNLPLYFSTQFIPVSGTTSNNKNPILFPGKSAVIPYTDLSNITIYDVIPTTEIADLLCFTNLICKPAITGGKVDTSWFFCSNNGIITLGGTATMTIKIDAPAYIEPKPNEYGLNVGRVNIGNFGKEITQTFQIPATQLTVVEKNPRP